MLKIVTEHELGIIIDVIEEMLEEINLLKDGKAHKSHCGCPECDRRINVYNNLDGLFPYMNATSLSSRRK